MSDSIYPLFGFNVSPRHSRIGSDAKGAAEELDRSYHVGMGSIDFFDSVRSMVDHYCEKGS